MTSKSNYIKLIFFIDNYFLKFNKTSNFIIANKNLISCNNFIKIYNLIGKQTNLFLFFQINILLHLYTKYLKKTLKKYYIKNYENNISYCNNSSNLTSLVYEKKIVKGYLNVYIFKNELFYNKNTDFQNRYAFKFFSTTKLHNNILTFDENLINLESLDKNIPKIDYKVRSLIKVKNAFISFFLRNLHF